MNEQEIEEKYFEAYLDCRDNGGDVKACRLEAIEKMRAMGYEPDKATSKWVKSGTAVKFKPMTSIKGKTNGKS